MTRRESFLLLAASSATAQQANLDYRIRGRYREGIRTAPSSPLNLDLVAALADYREPHSQPPPPMFRARFYLPNQDAAHLTIRETQPDAYFYWLESLKEEEQRWQAGDFAKRLKTDW